MNPAFYVNFSRFDGTEDHACFDDLEDAIDFYTETICEAHTDFASLRNSDGCMLTEHFADEDGQTDYEDSEELARLMENPGFAAMMEDADSDDYIG